MPHFFVTLPPSSAPGELVGCVGLAAGSAGAAPELGYWIARDHWGRGFASEAVRALLKLARVLGHRQIEARHFVDNPASGRVLVKAGFSPTGELRPSFSAGRVL